MAAVTAVGDHPPGDEPGPHPVTGATTDTPWAYMIQESAPGRLRLFAATTTHALFIALGLLGAYTRPFTVAVG